jgi:hypothetical protein
MLTDTQEGKALINEAAYQIIVGNAPQELPLYVTTRDQYFADPEKFTQSVEAEDEELGFGATIAVQTLTQAVFPILTPILAYILDKVAGALQKEGGERAADWVSSLFKDTKPKPVFTQTQLEVIASAIQEIARTEADRLGLETSQARTVSDAVIARLALAKL